MPTTKYPKNPNVETAFVTDDEGHRTRAVKTVVLDGTIDYPKNPNSPGCYVTVEGQKQRALMTADISSEGTLEYPNNSNSTKGYVTVDGKKQRVVLTAALVGGGSTPTGTINITENGTYDVTDYASADVNVPGAPDRYVEKTVDENGQLINGATTPIDLSGVKTIGNNVLYYAYANDTTLTTVPDFSDITSILNNGLAYAFSGCTNMTGTVNFASLKTFSTSSAGLNNTFYNSGITGVNFTVAEDLGSMTGTFGNCTSLISVNAPAVLKATNLQTVFSGCTALPGLDLRTMLSATSLAGLVSGCTSLTSLRLDNLIRLNACGSICAGCTALETMSFPRLGGGLANNAFATAFQNSGLKSLSFGGFPLSAANYNAAFTNTMLSGVDGCTVHFPAEWQTAMSSWSSVTSGFGGTNTTVLFDLPNIRALDLSDVKNAGYISGIYSALTAVTSVDLSGLEVDTAGSGTSLQGFCSGWTALESADVSGINDITQSMNSMFYGCTSLTNPDLSSVTRINTAQSIFSGCTSLVTFSFTSLRTMRGSASLRYAFQNDTALTDVYFPAIEQNVNYSQFNNMLAGCSNVTVHIPSNCNWTAANFGGTNTTVSKDLPSTVPLTGADTKTYYRSPKYDTASALAWTTDYLSLTDKFYTSGTTYPSAGDTIYSDAACTDAVTTIS